MMKKFIFSLFQIGLGIIGLNIFPEYLKPMLQREPSGNIIYYACMITAAMVTISGFINLKQALYK